MIREVLFAAALLFSRKATFGFSPSLSSTSRRQVCRLFLDGDGMAAGDTKHMLGNVLRSLQPRYLSQVAASVAGNAKGMKPINVTDAILREAARTVPSWDELANMLRENDTSEADNVSVAQADKRLFGHKEPRVLLYRDSASWCPYCQKVWIALELKRIPYEVRRIDMRCYGSSKPAEFLKLQPSGNLPCAIIDGKVYGESDEIVDIIDNMDVSGTGRPPKYKLRPPGSKDRMKYLCDDGKYDSLERRLYSRWMWWLTGKRKPDEYRDTYLERLEEVEEALGADRSGPYFFGSSITLADIRFIPFIERQIASLAYFKGYDLRDPEVFPHLCSWLDAMESHPSYLATKSDYYTHSRALPPQLSADCQFEPGCEDLRDAIDSAPIGNNQIDWDWRDPGWPSEGDPRKEAAERLIKGRDKIVRFACRGAGLPGFPASVAPLADPKAVINEDAIASVDLLLREAAHSLLTLNSGTRTSKVGNIFSKTEKRTAMALSDCLCYLRARIGVPRDMSYPAAQELRIELRNLEGELRSGILLTEFEETIQA